VRRLSAVSRSRVLRAIAAGLVGTALGVGGFVATASADNTPQPPLITSATSTQSIVGSLFSFSVTTTGFPTAALTETGALPPGITFVDNGDGTATIAGTSGLGSGGAYAISITADNGDGTPATQPFTLANDEAPAVTSSASAQAGVGSPFSFTVTTTGFPAPTLTEMAALPAGISFTDNGDGTAAIAGTPSPGSGGTYAISISANNGVGTPATQPFTLTNDDTGVFTSASTAQAAVGSPFSFTVTTTGFPTPALTETGSLPTGITFTDSGNGTATIAGTSAPGSGGTYVISITANNGVGTPVTQAFRLVNVQSATITSAASAPDLVGFPFSFTVTTRGVPTAALTEAGSLPTGITFTDNGNGTATIAGTATPNSGGTYAISITANDGVGTPVTQPFSLVNFESSTMTSAAGAQALVGSPFNFTVTTRGFPRPALTETGALPPGITFKDNGNGSATISGLANVGAGPYSLTISATNWVNTAKQSFALGNDQSPQITSRDYVATPAGAATWGAIFTVTTTGYPTPAITETGALPPGVTFKDNGNGTAVLTGIPPVGSDGQYPLTMTATNGIGSPIVQPFRMTVGYIPPSTRVADVGDSITMLSTNAIESALSPSYFLQINGFVADTMADQFPTIEAFQNDPTGAPTDWIIELGTNDMLGKNPNWSAGFQNEVNYLSKAHCVVLLTVSPHLKSIDSATPALNKMIKSAPLNHKNMHILDWGTIEYQNPSWLYADGIHPTPGGQTELASLELKALKKNC